MRTDQPRRARAEVLECTAAEYHNDPCEVPSLSSSIAKILAERSPLHAWCAHPRLGGQPRAPTSAMRRGVLIHKLLLDSGPEIVVVNEKDWRKKDAKAERAKADAEGKIAVLKGPLQRARDATGHIRERLKKGFGIEFTGHSEVPVRWEAESFQGPAVCRSMFDHVINHTIYDVKTCEDASLAKLSKKIVDLGYDIQHAAYTTALAALKPELIGRVDYVFLFVEVKPPYAVVPARLDAQLRLNGEVRWSEAVDSWSYCLGKKEWPSYTDEIAYLEAPPWALTEGGSDGEDEEE